MKLLVVSRRESDISKILLSLCDGDIISPEEREIKNIKSYDCAAILGGTEEKPLVLNAYLRAGLEEFADTGKPVFLEYTDSFRCVYSASPVPSSPHRLVCCRDITEAIREGDLLDSHYNNYIRPHFFMPETEVLLHYSQFAPAHDKIKDYKYDNNCKDAAFFKSQNLLTAAFRMCDYIKSSFAPKQRWDSLLGYICTFLGLPEPKEYPKPMCGCKTELKNDFFTELDKCIDAALELLQHFLVTPDGRKGIREGYSHNILPDGKRISADVIRTDCIGEAAGAFLFSGNDRLNDIGKAMLDLCYGPLTVHGGEYDGMVRWSEQAWNVCYQDDVARAIMPSLLYAYFGFSDKYVKNAENALQFLCDTTCADGLRPMRTDVLNYIGKDMRSLAQEEHGYASAHYNSWYSAALLLCYMLTGNEKIKETGIKGLEALMSLYPDTVREHSETSEQCRLIFPLAVLYAVTKDKKHYDMLDRVFDDLQKRRHPSGGYAEWDTGYKATCFNNAGGECSLLAENGDPVSDLLYSVNWLPLGFAFAYHVTGEERFLVSWKDICTFFIKAQISSADDAINGAWCRGIDLDRLEYCGIPHDVGWGPCCVETGWTVAEITMGMLVGKGIITGNLKDRNKK